MRFYICSTKYIHGKTCIHHYFLKPVNNEQIHLTVDEMNAMKKEIRKVLIGMDILCLLCIFCHTRTMGNGLVAALAADAITLVAADLHKTKER